MDTSFGSYRVSDSENDSENDDNDAINNNDDLSSFSKERLEALLQESDSDIDSNVESTHSHITSRPPIATSKLVNTNQQFVPKAVASHTTSASDKVTISRTTTITKVEAAAADDISVDSLETAEQYENALLNVAGAPTKPYGPLAARRKRSLANEQHSNNNINKPPSPSSAITLQGGAQVVQTRVLHRVSSHLQRSAQAKHTGHGLPTSVAVHSRFIAIGTSRAKVLIFDHNEELRTILGNTSNSDRTRKSSGLKAMQAGLASAVSTSSSSSEDVLGPVTALDVSPAADLLVCGYSNGRVTLWDILRSSPLKSVSDAHSCAVSSVRFWKSQTPHVVSIDTRGIANVLTFSKVFMVHVVDKQCLLDGSAGQIVALSPLMRSQHNNTKEDRMLVPTDTGSFIKIPTLVAMGSMDSTFIVALEPEAKVLYRWPKPSMNMGTTDCAGVDRAVPSVSWGWSKVHGLVEQPTLARGWGSIIEVLQVNAAAMMGSVGDSGSSGATASGATAAAAGAGLGFDVVATIPVPLGVMAVEWLGGDTLLFLNTDYDLCVFDVAAMAILETTNVRSVQLVWTTFAYPSSSPLTPAPSTSGTAAVASNGESKSAVSFQNSFRAHGTSLYLLGIGRLLVAKVQSWTERVDVLVQANGWLDALALALDHYELVLKPAFEISALGQTLLSGVHDGVGGGSSSGGGSLGMSRDRTSNSGDRDRVCDLLLQYVNLSLATLAIGDDNNDPHASQDLGNGQEEEQQGREEEERDPVTTLTNGAGVGIGVGIKSGPGVVSASDRHMKQLVEICAVAFEYLVVIDRLDLLFGEIFDCFKTVTGSSSSSSSSSPSFSSDSGEGVFYRQLESYIVSDHVRRVEPSVLRSFVEYHRHQNSLWRVEQCILHLDPSLNPLASVHMDLDFLVRLCRSNRLYSALIYLYNSGLNDWVTPFANVVDDMLILSGIDASEFQAGGRTDDGTKKKASEGAADVRWKRMGFKAMLYLIYSFTGRGFAQAHIPEYLVPQVRADVLRCLFQLRSSPQRKTTWTNTTTTTTTKYSDKADKANELNRLHRELSFPRLRVLLAVDVADVLHVLEMAIDSPGGIFDHDTVDNELSLLLQDDRNTASGSRSSNMSNQQKEDASCLSPSLRAIFHAAASIFLPELFPGLVIPLPAELASGALTSPLVFEHNVHARQLFLDFVFRSVAAGTVMVGNVLVQRLLEHVIPTVSETNRRARTARPVQGKNNDEEGIETLKNNGKISESKAIRLVHRCSPRQYKEEILVARARALGWLRVVVMMLQKGLRRKLDNGASQAEISKAVDAILEASLARVSTTSTFSEENSNDILLKNQEDSNNNLEDETGAAQKELFAYIDALLETAPSERLVKALKQGILSYLQELIRFDRAGTSRLVIELFPNETSVVIKTLAEPQLQFAYLQHVISSKNAKSVVPSRVVIGDPVVISQDIDADDRDEEGRAGAVEISADVQKLYIELMCRFAPRTVYRYLCENDGSYAVDVALAVCRRHQINEATAYLLERTGDIDGALTLMLAVVDEHYLTLAKTFEQLYTTNADTQELSSHQLKRATFLPAPKVQTLFREISSHQQQQQQHLNVPQVRDAEASLRVAMQLCERNSSVVGAGTRVSSTDISADVGGPVSSTTDGDDSHGDALWFRLFDQAVEALKRYKPYDEPMPNKNSNNNNNNNISNDNNIKSGRLDKHDSEEGIKRNKRNGSLSTPPSTLSWQEVTHKCLLGFLRTIMDGMLANVRMEKVLRKIVDNHHTEHFGHFRDSILCMLDAYSYERSTLKTANKLLVHDVHELVQSKHSQVAKATRVRSLGGRDRINANNHTMLRTGFHVGERDVLSLDENDGDSQANSSGVPGDDLASTESSSQRNALARVRLAESRARYFDPIVDLSSMLDDFLGEPDAQANMDTLLRGTFMTTTAPLVDYNSSFLF